MVCVYLSEGLLRLFFSPMLLRSVLWFLRASSQTPIPPPERLPPPPTFPSKDPAAPHNEEASPHCRERDTHNVFTLIFRTAHQWCLCVCYPLTLCCCWTLCCCLCILSVSCWTSRRLRGLLCFPSPGMGPPLQLDPEPEEPWRGVCWSNFISKSCCWEKEKTRYEERDGVWERKVHK